MSVTVTVNITESIPHPVNGYKVFYRIKGTTDSYTEVDFPSPYTLPFTFTTSDDPGTLYEGYVKCSCEDVDSNNSVFTTPCNCPDDYIVSPDGTFCYKIETEEPTVTHSDYCLALSQNGAYSNFGARIYAIPYDNTKLANPQPPAIAAGVVANLPGVPQWSNGGSSATLGAMNRRAVWVDSNCDGTKDPLSPGEQATIVFTYVNNGVARYMYVGVGGDNYFNIKLNGSLIADSASAFGADTRAFKIWHLIPLFVPSGPNYFNIVATGDGSVNDALGVAIYDNTAAELIASTSDADLNILFDSVNLRGQPYEIATCDEGWSLDETDGVFTCKRTLDLTCNTPES